MATSHSIPAGPKTSFSTLRMGSAWPAAGLMMTFTRMSAASLEVRASGHRWPLALEPVLLEGADPPLDVRRVWVGHGPMRHDNVHRLVRCHPPGDEDACGHRDAAVAPGPAVDENLSPGRHHQHCSGRS